MTNMAPAVTKFRVQKVTWTVSLPRTISIGYVADMAIIPAVAPAPSRKTGVSWAFSAEEKKQTYDPKNQRSSIASSMQKARDLSST